MKKCTECGYEIEGEHETHMVDYWGKKHPANTLPFNGWPPRSYQDGSFKKWLIKKGLIT